MSAKRTKKTVKKAQTKVSATPLTSAALREILERIPENQLVDHSGVNRGMIYMIKTGQANASAETVGNLLRAMAASSAEKLLQAFFDDTAARIAEEDPSESVNCVIQVRYPPKH